MHTFDFLFGVSLGNLLLRHTDNLSKSLQKKSLSAAEGQRLAGLTLDVLCDGDNFDSFYARVLQYQVHLEVGEPTLPRKRMAPQRLLVGSTTGDFHSTPDDRYRQIYYEALDFVVQAVIDLINLAIVCIKTCRSYF